MPRLEKTHDVSHTAGDMFELVCDVESYPIFVPLCQTLNVRSSKQKGEKKLVVADMTMAYGMLSETFTTQVLMDREALRIDVKYVDGPFRHLDNEWLFDPLSEASCRVHFMVDYELRNRVLSAAAGAVFEAAFGRFVSAFERRADAVYGVA